MGEYEARFIPSNIEGLDYHYDIENVDKKELNKIQRDASKFFNAPLDHERSECFLHHDMFLLDQPTLVVAEDLKKMQERHASRLPKDKNVQGDDEFDGEYRT